MAVGTQTRRIFIKVDTQGNRDIQNMSKQLGMVTKNTRSLAQNFSFLKNTFLSYIGAIGIREIVQMSDSIQLLGDRIEVLTGGQADAYETLVQLRDVADATQTSLDTTADSFTRMSAAIGGTGIKTKFLIGITKVLQDSFLVAGATLKETTATTVQLAQAFASGEVRGQELRSVMEQNAVVAKLLRKEYGKDIYKKAATGAITATDVLRILFQNQEKLAEQAKNLKPTIEKTIVAALNGVRLAIFKLNRDLDISGNFAKSLNFMIDKFSLFAALLGVIALTQIPRLGIAIIFTLLPALSKLGASLAALALKNPFTALLLGVTLTVFFIVDNLEKLEAHFNRFQAVLKDMRIAVNTFSASTTLKTEEGLKRLQRIADLNKKLEQEAADLRANADKVLNNKNKKPGFGLDPDFVKEQLAAYDKLLGGGAGSLEKRISFLNVAFQEGEIGVREYFEELNKAKIDDLSDKFATGKVSLQDFSKQLSDLKLQSIDGLSVALDLGGISLKKYNELFKELRIKELQAEMASGLITLREYNREIQALNDRFSFSASFNEGVQNYIEGIGTLSENVTSAITRSFSTLENELINLAQTRKFEFNRFAESILIDLARIALRMYILKPLAESIFGGGSAPVQLPASNFNPNVVAGKGAAFENGVRKFASGGIVNSPTLFNYGSKTGLMGEAGPEAILPLTRNKGKLGVEASVSPVNINIINNSDTSIDTKETFGSSGERNIEILIESKVRDGLSKGIYDRQLRSNFGITRKGY